MDGGGGAEGRRGSEDLVMLRLLWLSHAQPRLWALTFPSGEVAVSQRHLWEGRLALIGCSESDGSGHSVNPKTTHVHVTEAIAFRNHVLRDLRYHARCIIASYALFSNLLWLEPAIYDRDMRYLDLYAVFNLYISRVFPPLSTENHWCNRFTVH